MKGITAQSIVSSQKTADVGYKEKDDMKRISEEDSSHRLLMFDHQQYLPIPDLRTNNVFMFLRRSESNKYKKEEGPSYTAAVDRPSLQTLVREHSYKPSWYFATS